MDISISISIGELLDKISILEIKEEKIGDKLKLKEIRKELSILSKIAEDKLKNSSNWIAKLKKVNLKLWKIENDIRQKEREKSFEKEFIDLSRLVYMTNDYRFKIKEEINKFYGSQIKEQKSYNK